jgi:hypothetical protein
MRRAVWRESAREPMISTRGDLLPLLKVGHGCNSVVFAADVSFFAFIVALPWVAVRS